MKIELSTTAQEVIRSHIAAGSFKTPEEVVESALDLMLDPDELRRQVQIGIDQLDRGEFAEFTAEDVIAEARAMSRKKAI